MKAKYVSVKVKPPEFTVCNSALHHLPAGTSRPPPEPSYAVWLRLLPLPGRPSSSFRARLECSSPTLCHSGIKGSLLRPATPRSVPAGNRALVTAGRQGLPHRFRLPLDWELLEGRGWFISLSSNQPDRSLRFTGLNLRSLEIRV